MTSKDTISQIHFNLKMMGVTNLIAPCCSSTLQEALNFKMHNPLTQNIQSPPDTKVKLMVWIKGNPLTLLVGMQTSTATMENSAEIS